LDAHGISPDIERSEILSAGRVNCSKSSAGAQSFISDKSNFAGASVSVFCYKFTKMLQKMQQ
jgi:hypothetical protein